MTKVLQDDFGFERRKLLNDLEATANYIPHLQRNESRALNTGDPSEHGMNGVIAPGTGMGEAFLIWNGDLYHPNPSEGGHCDFAPSSTTEEGLLEYLQKKFKHVSYERVCSGALQYLLLLSRTHIL